MQPFPPINPRAAFVWHGGDYNPEQWPVEIWDEDVRLMQLSDCTVLTVGVFSWVTLQPDEQRFRFDWLDTIFEKLAASGRMVCLATPTAALPAWLSQRYPEVLRVNEHGQRRHHGERTAYCPTSPVYRQFATQIASRLAERYHNHPALVAWHICNEYGGTCYCDVCAAAFRVWLRERHGTLEVLNARWWTAFWSHTYTDWEQIEPPFAEGERSIHGQNIDYLRFQNAMQLQCFKLERDAIRAFSPDVPITTNLMGTYFKLDYRTWAKEMDVISWDCYPQPGDHPAHIAFLHDLNRGLRDGQPFLLMEQTPSSQNWQPINALKRPGVLRLWSYQALAHGAESVMYFQWRRGRGGSEKFHGAVIEQSGRSDTRVFREVSALGAELARLGTRTLGGVTPARVAILFDWENWWAIQDAIGPVREKRYQETVRKHYQALWQRAIPIDIIFSDSDLSAYQLVIAPMLAMIKPGVAERIAAFVRQGGTFVTTYFSGIVNEHDLAFAGAPGPLRELLGIRVEEIDALYPEQQNAIVMHATGERYRCGRLCDILHSEGAEVLASYASDFYAGMPVLTRHAFGAGHAYYIGSEGESDFLDMLYQQLLTDAQIHAPFPALPEGVEVTLRETTHGRIFFLLNHTASVVTVPLPADGRYHDLIRDQPVQATCTLAAYDVALLEPIV